MRDSLSSLTERTTFWKALIREEGYGAIDSVVCVCVRVRSMAPRIVFFFLVFIFFAMRETDGYGNLGKATLHAIEGYCPRMSSLCDRADRWVLSWRFERLPPMALCGLL